MGLEFKIDRPLELSQVKVIFEKWPKDIDGDEDDCPHFHEMMSGCEMVLPEPKFPPRNPELEARIKKLRAEQENREYRKMTENIDGKWKLGKTELSEESISKQRE